MLKKAKKSHAKKKSREKTKKMQVKETKEPEPAPRKDINTNMYRDLFKFLEEKVSMECFIDVHDQCYGKKDCKCECHKK